MFLCFVCLLNAATRSNDVSGGNLLCCEFGKGCLVNLNVESHMLGLQKAVGHPTCSQCMLQGRIANMSQSHDRRPHRYRYTSICGTHKRHAAGTSYQAPRQLRPCSKLQRDHAPGMKHTDRTRTNPKAAAMPHFPLRSTLPCPRRINLPLTQPGSLQCSAQTWSRTLRARRFVCCSQTRWRRRRRCGGC